LKRIRARTRSRDYDVLVGTGVLDELGSALLSRHEGGKCVVCCDENVASLYLERARASLAGSGFAVSSIVIPAGEQQKTLQRVQELYGVLYERRLQRSDTIVALGGGVIGDLAGFVAASYLRGVGFVQAPTTLLAQVDASIGGKVGVDFRDGKNYVGTFYQPLMVIADLATLATLPEREVRCGSAEVAKYAMLAGGGLLADVERCAASAATFDEAIICACVESKVAVVRADEREESGERAVLNLGHTIGHAIEAATGFSRFAHGEAVGLGLRATLRLSQELTGLADDEAERGQALLSALGLAEKLAAVDGAAVCAAIGRDKKADHMGSAYVLLESLGRVRRDVRVPREIERGVVEWLTAR
jgi:3-dehydroquinate synthase